MISSKTFLSISAEDVPQKMVFEIDRSLHAFLVTGNGVSVPPVATSETFRAVAPGEIGNHRYNSRMSVDIMTTQYDSQTITNDDKTQKIGTQEKYFYFPKYPPTSYVVVILLFVLLLL